MSSLVESSYLIAGEYINLCSADSNYAHPVRIINHQTPFSARFREGAEWATAPGIHIEGGTHIEKEGHHTSSERLFLVDRVHHRVVCDAKLGASTMISASRLHKPESGAVSVL